MPTQGLAAVTEAVANDITGYFQRHAVVRARRAGAAGGCMPTELYTALALQSLQNATVLCMSWCALWQHCLEAWHRRPHFAECLASRYLLCMALDHAQNSTAPPVSKAA